MEGSPATLARSLATSPQADGQEKAEGKKNKKTKKTHHILNPNLIISKTLSSLSKCGIAVFQCFRFSFVISKLNICSAFNKEPPHTNFCSQNLTSCMHKMLTSKTKLLQSRQKCYRTTYDRFTSR